MMTGSGDFTAIREAHYVKHFGLLSESIMHSTDEKTPHVDIYRFPPFQDRHYWTLITGGMSDFRQSVPDDAPEHVSPRTEILLYVRAPQPWMFSVLKGLAEMPFDDQTFLHWWHTVPNGMPMTAKPSLLTNFFFLPPYFEKEGFDTLEIGGDKVNILWLIPITDAELHYKLEHGGRALEELFSQKELDPVVDESRKSLV